MVIFPKRWDGKVFLQSTIAFDGFSMVLLQRQPDHHHWMFFPRLTIDIDGFSMVFLKYSAMVNDGHDP